MESISLEDDAFKGTRVSRLSVVAFTPEAIGENNDFLFVASVIIRHEMPPEPGVHSRLP